MIKYVWRVPINCNLNKQVHLNIFWFNNKSILNLLHKENGLCKLAIKLRIIRIHNDLPGW